MRAKNFSLSLFLVLSVFLNSKICLGMAQRPPRKPYIIRVAIINGSAKLTLRISGPYRIVLPNTFEELLSGVSLHEAEVEPDFSGIKIGENPLGVFGIKIFQPSEGSIFINGRRFRGAIDIIRNQDMKLVVINHIDIEDYLLGVLYHEVSHRWPMEVLKAQAIASRTYAVYQNLVNKDKEYDLTSDVYSQVYGGRTSEKGRTNRAVRLTAGKILKFNGEVFPTYFHAACGGRTSDADTLWKTDLPTLKGKVCPYCSDSPHFKWTDSISISELEEKLKKNGYTVGDILSLQVLERDSANRVLNLKIEDSEDSLFISGNRFRLIAGPNIIRSTNFEVSFENQRLNFRGFGWGHGVGMCQWGAYHMSRRGKSAEEILRYYYPGAGISEIEK